MLFAGMRDDDAMNRTEWRRKIINYTGDTR